MSDLLANLKERHIWRVLIVYPSVTFIWLQAVEFFINNYDLDSRLLTASLLAAIVLFPAAVVWNWQHGESGSQRFSRSEVASYVFIGIASIAVVGWYWTATPASTRPMMATNEIARSVAVLPFQNEGDNAEVQFLCDGIAESLINWLATVPDIKVASKSASFRMRDNAIDAIDVAEALGVDAIITGNLEQVGDQIVISVSMIDARDDSLIWGDRLFQKNDEVLYLERTIVSSIKDSLRLKVTDSVSSLSASGGTDNPAAYKHFLRGHFLIQSTNSESIDEGLTELREAISLDPQFALPYADIADALSQKISYGSSDQDALLIEARSAAYAAVALAPDLAEAHTALATINQFYLMDWETTDQSYENAIASNPISATPYHRYTDWLVLSLRFERAKEMAALAIARDPLDSSAMHAVGLAALFSGDFAGAARAFGEWNQFHPNSRWSFVKHSVALSLNGQCGLAATQVDAVVSLHGASLSPLMKSWIAWGFKVCGNDAMYDKWKDDVMAAHMANPQVIDGAVAYIYALEGDTDSLVGFISRVVAERHPLTVFTQVFSALGVGFTAAESLRADPRYIEILEGLNFPPRDEPQTGDNTTQLY